MQGSFPKQRQLRIIFFAAVFLGLSEVIARAQPSPSLEMKTTAMPTPIPLSEIASQTESTLRTISNIETTLSTDPITASVEKRLPGLTTEIELRGAEMAKYLAGAVPPELLHSMEIVLENYRNQLSSWNHDLTERSNILDGQIAQSNKLGHLWRITLQLPELSQAAPEILKRVQSLIELIDRTRQEAESVRKRDLILQGRVLGATTRLQAIAPAFEQAETSATKNLFVQDSQPLWRMRVEPGKDASRASLIPPASAALFKAYIKRTAVVVYLHIAVVVGLSISLFWLRRRVHQWTEEERSLQHAALLLDLPVPTAITISFLAFGSIYSLAPFLLRAILWGVLLISITLILRRLVNRALFPLLNALIVLYFVDQWRLLTALLPVFGRLVFAAEMLGATLFLIWFIQTKGSATVGDNPSTLFAQGIRFAIQICLIVFPVALLANIFGYVNFANLLAGGLIRSAYVGAAVYTAVRAIEGLVMLALWVRPLSLLRLVRVHRPTLHGRISAVVKLLAFIYWTSLTLDFLGLRTPPITRIEEILRTNLAIGNLSISLQQVLVFSATVWAAFALSRFLRFLLEEDVYSHWHLARGIPQAISALVHYAVLLIGFFVGLAVLGIDLTKVTILAGAFTVGVGFGLQTVINNFVSGLILLFERPIKVGDTIQIDTDIGEVRRIGIRACIIRTTDGSEVIVPNGTIIANKVTNWTGSDRYRAIELPIMVARGVTPQQVIGLLQRVAAEQPGITKEPLPQAYVVNVSSAAIGFILRAWTDQYEQWIQVRSDLAVAIDEALSRENIAVA
jgi:small-conductance mechanosensitive channel